MLCSEFQLVKSGDGFEDVKPLPCNRWSCAYCAPRRRAALVAQAVAGTPNKILTITVNPAVGDSPEDRRRLLHDAWKRLVKRALRQFRLTPEVRWRLKAHVRTPERERRIRSATSQTPAGLIRRLHYMAFIERTKRGEPHLHILLRCPFVPQDWISEQMQDMLGSPIVWIEVIKGTAAAVRYVTKYVGKAPAQFGTAKRYWVSAEWVIVPPDAPPPPPLDMTGVKVRRTNYPEWLEERRRLAWVWAALEDGWTRYTYPVSLPPLRTRWQQRPRDWIKLAEGAPWHAY